MFLRLRMLRWFLLSVTATLPLAAQADAVPAADWKDNLTTALRSRITLTETDNARLRIESPGTILVVQRDGLTASPAQDGSMLVNTVDGDRIKQPGGMASLLTDKKANRDFTAGERLYCIAIKVKDESVQLWLLTVQTASVTIRGNTQQTRYKAAVEFRFPRGALASGGVDSVLGRIAPVLAIDHPAGPRTVTLGQTVAELEAALGKPEKVIDLGTKTIYVYKDLKVTLVEGKVTDVQ